MVKKLTIGILLGLILALALSACAGIGARNTLVDRSLSGSRLVMDVDEGSIEILAGQEPDIRVLAVQTGGELGAYSIQVGQEGSTVLISDRSRYCGFPCFRRLRYTVLAPPATPLHISTGSGSVSIQGMAGGVHVGTGSGRVTLSGVNGELSLAAGSGDIRVHDASQSQLTVGVASGDFDYTGSLAANGDNNVEIGSGRVNLRLPADSRFHLEASTGSGRVRSNFILQDAQSEQGRLSGVANGGGALLEIIAGSGSITVNHP